MEISLNRDSTTPLYQQLRNQIRDQIISGELTDGFKLPSERQLVERLEIHRNTVKKAYEQLMEEGLIYSSAKSPRGYFVRGSRAGAAAKDAQNERFGMRRAFSSLDKNFNYQFLGMQNTFQRFYNSSYLSEAIPFAGVLANEEALPMEYLREILREMAQESTLEPFWFCDPQGTEHFRMALADMLFGRNIYVPTEQIQAISETYEALSNIAFMYLKEGDYAVVEEPAVPAVVNIFLHTGAQVLLVPMERDGMKIEALESLVERYHPKLIYTLPNFHNPTGAVMSLMKRRQLLKCAYSRNIPVVEDDSLRDFNYDGIRLPSLYSMDRTSSVIYMDSFNLSSFFPGARIGYMIGPENVIKTYRRIINKDQLFLGSMSQYMWARFYEKGYYDKHRVFLADFYRKKRDRMVQALSKIPGLVFEIPAGGLVCWVRLPEGMNDRQVTAAAERKGLLLMPGNTFFAEGSRGESYLRISFSSASDEQIDEGAGILTLRAAAASPTLSIWPSQP